MGGIRKKLRSRRGTSILLALVFFLVCAFVAAVILGAAAANARKTAGREAEQQTYYSVSSAARLLQNVMDGAVFTGREYRTLYGCQNAADLADEPHTDTSSVDSLSAVSITAQGAVADYLKEQAYRVFLSGTEYVGAAVFSAQTVSFTIAADGMDPVDVTMAVDGHYTATFTLRSQTSPGKYAMTLRCLALSPQPVSAVSESDDTHSVWDDEGNISDRTFTRYDYIRTTAVTWSRGTISKGVDADA